MSKGGTDRVHSVILRLLILSAAGALGSLQIWAGLALQPPSLVINEVAYRGTEASSSDEWIELYHPGSDFLDLLGWTLFIDDRALPLQGVIKPYGFYVLERTDDEAISDRQAELIYTGAMKDSGVILRLVNERGLEVDRLSAWHQQPSDRSTLERVNPLIAADQPFNWRVAAPGSQTFHDAEGNLLLGTPGAINSWTHRVFGYGYGYPVPQPGPPPDPPQALQVKQVDQRLRIAWLSNQAEGTAILKTDAEEIDLGPGPEFFWTPPEQTFPLSASVFQRDLFLQRSEQVEVLIDYEPPRRPQASEILINELLPHPLDDDPEWIELFNTSDDWLRLSDCQLEDERATILTFAETAAIAGGSIRGFELSSSRLNNAGDDLKLSCSGQLIDRISYGDHAHGEPYPTPRGFPQSLGYLPMTGEGQSLGRVGDGGDHWFVFTQPSPGEANLDDLSHLINTAPQAVITIQGNGSPTGCRVLHFNPTAADSLDKEDNILLYDWVYRQNTNGQELFSIRKENPTSFRFDEDMGSHFTVQLTVTDLFGRQSQREQELELGHCAKRKGSAPSGDQNPEGFEAIHINELFPNPSGKDRGQEWVELWNSGPENISLEGWSLGGKYKKPLSGISLDSHEFLIFEKASLRNKGDRIELIAPEGNVVDTVSYQKASEGQSYARKDNGVFQWTVPTPGEGNDFPFAPEVIYLHESAPIIITQLLPNPKGKDDGREWIKILNRSDEDYQLEAWQLDNREGGSSPYTLPSLRLAPGQSTRFSSAETGITLRNSGDQARILDSSGQLVDQLEWTTEVGSGVILRRQDLVHDGAIPPDKATVLKVIDGDTIDVRIQGRVERVRLIGVDTPETVHPFKEVETFGKEASDFTRSQLEGQEVRLEYDLSRRGKYGRLLAYIYLEDRHFNAELIQEGYAFAYLKYPFRYREDFRLLEKTARQQGKGLWADQQVDRIRQAQEAVQDEEAEEMEIIEERIEELTEPAEEEKPLLEEDPDKRVAITGRIFTGQAYQVQGWDQIRLSEVLSNPSGRDGQPSGDFGEFIELENRGQEAVSLLGWSIVNSKDKPVFSGEDPSLSIAPQGFRVLLPSRRLRNREETLLLIDPLGQQRDRFFLTEHLKDDHAWARPPGSGNWRLTRTPTPGQANQISTPRRKASTRSRKIKPFYRIRDDRPPRPEQANPYQETLLGALVARSSNEKKALALEESDAQQEARQIFYLFLTALALLTLWPLLPNLGAIFSPKYGVVSARTTRT